MNKIKQILVHTFDNNNNCLSTSINQLMKYDEFDNKIIDLLFTGEDEETGLVDRQFTLKKFDKKNNPTNEVLFSDSNKKRIEEDFYTNMYPGIHFINENKYNEEGQLVEVKELRNRGMVPMEHGTGIKKYEYDKVFSNKVSIESYEIVNYKNKKIYSDINKNKYNSDGRLIERRHTHKPIYKMKDIEEPHNTYKSRTKYSYYFDDENNQIKESLIFVNDELQQKRIESIYNFKSYSGDENSPSIETDYEYENGLKKFKTDKNQYHTSKNTYEKEEYVYEDHKFLSNPFLIISMNSWIRWLGQDWTIG